MKNPTIKKLQIWTDGSCYWKPKLGGIGVYILHEDGREEFLQKGYKDTTTTRMEIRAVLAGIQKINKNVPVEANFYIDNEHVCFAISKKLLWQWEKNGLDNYKNSDLWKKVLHEIRERPLLKIYANSILGHQKITEGMSKKKIQIIVGNDIADTLADYKQFSTYCQDLRY